MNRQGEKYSSDYSIILLKQLKNERQCVCMCVQKHNMEARSSKHCCRGKTICVTYSECLSVALVIQHLKHMRRIILPYVACLVTLSHKRYNFRVVKNYWAWNVCFDFLYKCVWYISHSKTNSAIYCHKWIIVFVQSTAALVRFWWKLDCLAALVRFWWKLDCLNWFSKNTQISNFLKIRSLGSCGKTDGQTKRRRS